MTDERKDEGAPSAATIILPGPHAEEAGGSEPPPVEPPVIEAPVIEPAVPPRAPSLLPALIGAVVVLLLLIGLAPFWAPPLSSVLPWGQREAHGSDPVAPLQQRLAAAEDARRTLEQRLARLEQQAKASPTTAPAPDMSAVTALADRIAPLSDRIAALEQRPAPTPPDVSGAVAPLQARLQQVAERGEQTAAQVKQLSDRVDQMTAQLDKLSRTEASDGADRVLLLAIADLRGAVATSRPFTSELATVTSLAQNKPAALETLKPLQSQAAQGIPGTAMLSDRFTREIAPALLHDAAAPAADSGFGDRVLARVTSLVQIRRVDENGAPTGDAVSDAVAHTQAALAKGDLAGAVAALADLPAPAAKIAAPWLDAARQRLAAEAALAGLSQQVAADLGRAAPASTEAR